MKRKESDEKFYVLDIKLFELLVMKLLSLIIEFVIKLVFIYVKDERNEYEMNVVEFFNENK